MKSERKDEIDILLEIDWLKKGMPLRNFGVKTGDPAAPPVNERFKPNGTDQKSKNFESPPAGNKGCLFRHHVMSLHGIYAGMPSRKFSA